MELDGHFTEDLETDNERFAGGDLVEEKRVAPFQRLFFSFIFFSFLFLPFWFLFPERHQKAGQATGSGVTAREGPGSCECP